ncbi:hypothetical protein ACTFIW_005168 [Dictyostelium discoideum]
MIQPLVQFLRKYVNLVSIIKDFNTSQSIETIGIQVNVAINLNPFPSNHSNDHQQHQMQNQLQNQITMATSTTIETIIAAHESALKGISQKENETKTTTATKTATVASTTNSKSLNSIDGDSIVYGIRKKIVDISNSLGDRGQILANFLITLY